MIKGFAKQLVRRLGYEIHRRAPEREFPADFSPEDIATCRAVKPFTMTSPARVFALMRSIEHVVRAGIPGSIVECGVWRGGSMMAAARTLLGLGRSDVELVLFDTFEGMPAPGRADVNVDGGPALSKFLRTQQSDLGSTWCQAGLEEVRANLLGTGYDAARIRFVVGRVEDTLPAAAPDAIALLRLDTDWYQSTRHELQHLYPRLARGGVLILDDYGHWRGARQAVDEHFAALGMHVLLHRIDESGRLLVKP